MNSRLHLPSLFLWSVVALAASVLWSRADPGPFAPAAVEGTDGLAGRQPGAEPSTGPSPEPSWDELRPDASDSDWIQLDSMEWLRGELKTIYKDKIEFDSENLGLLTIDMDDVIQPGYVGMVSKSEDRVISNNHRVTSNFDWYRTRHFFWRPFIGDLYVDTLQNIRHRILLGLGLGYDIIDTSRTTWTLFCGPAFRYTRFGHVSAVEARSEYSPAFVFSSEYQVELNRISDLEMDYHGTLVNSKAGTYMHRFSTSLKNEILDDLDLDFTFIWDTSRIPRRMKMGTGPKRATTNS